MSKEGYSPGGEYLEPHKRPEGDPVMRQVLEGIYSGAILEEWADLPHIDQVRSLFYLRQFTAALSIVLEATSGIKAEAQAAQLPNSLPWRVRQVLISGSDPYRVEAEATGTGQERCPPSESTLRSELQEVTDHLVHRVETLSAADKVTQKSTEDTVPVWWLYGP